MLGEGSPGHQYTYILPKNPTTQIIFPNQVKSPVTYILGFQYLSNIFQATFATSTKLMEPKPPRYRNFCPIQQGPSRIMTIFSFFKAATPNLATQHWVTESTVITFAQLLVYHLYLFKVDAALA